MTGFGSFHLLVCTEISYLGVFKGIKASVFGHYLSEKILEANRGIGLIHKLSKFLPRDSLLKCFEAYVRPHLDYGDIIYDYPGNATLSLEILNLFSITPV